MIAVESELLGRWAASSATMTLSKKKIWAEQPAGQEVVYRWVDWLSTSSWSCIASDDQIVFGPDADSDGGDDRAIGRSCSLDSMIPLIQRYSKERSHEIFARRIHECGVCLSENTGRNFIQLPCSHSFCVKCMETQMLDTMPDVAYCPRCSAACVAAGDDAQCSRCFFTFCAVCRERRHVGDTCVSPNQMLDIMLERQKEKRPSAAPSPNSQAVSEKRKMEELLSLREVMRTSRQCPSCKMAVSKTAGCNKMVCSNCGRPFCYRCSRAITGYEHFAGECKLFESVGKGWFPGQAMWMNLEYDYDEIAEIGTPSWIRATRYPCPTCGAKRTKRMPNPLLRAVLEEGMEHRRALWAISINVETEHSSKLETGTLKPVGVPVDLTPLSRNPSIFRYAPEEREREAEITLHYGEW
uniref:RBR-type E3 ubiquitin transferase n=1 Tax=Oryza glumipatula TaxID=40148 RepID=A0A0D9YWT0_9ORYZ